ncbi:unnamed protein product [Paramecium pentaurelia]|uniref:glutathione transferase n=1 Tax=Paramecium pentaurelia TaxID=43138 RepID=A0A8S1XND5_9CILI|nr:unnamed protein product [Paramecium pentaurelia]
MQDQLEFGYWTIRGIGQPLRYLLEYVEIPYTQKNFNIIESEWFDSVAKPPLNQEVLANLPYIKDGDKWIFESQALYIYIAYRANRADLLGSTNEEQVVVEQVKGVLLDLYRAFRSLIALPEVDYLAKKDEYFNTEVLWIIEKLNKFIQGKTWATGNNLTYVDFFQFELEQTLEAYKPGILDQFQNLRKHHDAFAEIPQIKRFISSERFIAQPFYPIKRWRWW